MNRPEVLIDGIAFEVDSQLGVWRLFYEVMSRTSSEVKYTILLSRTPLQPIPGGVFTKRMGPRYNPISRRQMHLRLLNWPFEQSLKIRSSNAIWHSTFYGTDRRVGARKVVTVFDMIAEKMYDIGPFVEQRERKARALADVDAVLAISQATATDLIRFHPDLAGKVQVMHLGGEHLGQSEGIEEKERRHAIALPTGQSYCLFVGGRYAYKNFTCVVDALSLPSWPESLVLVVIGVPFDDAEKAYINAAGVSSKIYHVGKVNDDTLKSYYRGATCFVYPSLMEGFGIPILEAQFLGTPTVISDTPVFREVAGDGAIFFQPQSPENLAFAIHQSLDAEARKRLISAATENCNRFSWDDAARVSIECYERLWSDRR